MAVTNDETTGRYSTCTACGHAIEEALLLKGFRTRLPDGPDGSPRVRISPGTPVWRRTDRAHGSAVCDARDDGLHQPGPIRRGRTRGTPLTPHQPKKNGADRG
jgi:hypothetical protein